MTTTMPAVLPPMLARMPRERLLCRYGTLGYCNAPATIEIAQVIPELWIKGYRGEDGTLDEALEALGERLLELVGQRPRPSWHDDLWKPVCDKHKAHIRDSHDHTDSTEVFLFERCLGTTR